MKTKRLFTIVVFLLSIVTLEGQSFNFNTTPSWSQDIHPEIESNFSKYDISSGAYYSMYDMQTNLETKEEFNHFVVDVVSRAGIISASEIQIVYDTTYQKLNFHYLYIWRKGKKIDRTKELTFEELNNENNLQSGIYSGLITAYDILEDIRVNDKIEFAYTIEGFNPIFDNKYCSLMPLVSDNPIDYYSFQVFRTKDTPLYYECNDCDDVKIQETETDDYRIVSLLQKDKAAYDSEQTVAVGYLPFTYFMFSKSKKWEEITDWALDVFHLEEEQDLEEVFDEIFDGSETKEEQMTAIIDYVQNDIRYMGIESGIGSIKPFPPMQVVKQRFGDCKDKSLLLCELFKKIGVESCYPALVNSGLAKGIDQLLPGAQFFDHCIVYYKYKGESYWLDPTIAQQGGDFKNRQIYNYGNALVIKKGEKHLQKIELNHVKTKTIVKEEYQINSFNDPAKLIVTSELYGSNADLFRGVMEYYSKKDMSEYLKSVYTPLFHSIAIYEDLKINDDVEKNVIVLTESYLISDLWTKALKNGVQYNTFQYEPLGMYSYMQPVDCERKKYPIMNAYPIEYELESTIILPGGIHMDGQLFKEENEAYVFSKNVSLINERTVKLKYQYYAKSSEISPEEFENICPKYSQISKEFPLVFSFPVQ